MAIYMGIRKRDGVGGQRVMKNDKLLDPMASLAVQPHSPTGFNWGYTGSGPAQLALAILLDHTGSAEIAQRYHQRFKDAFVAGFDDVWELDSTEINRWLLQVGASQQLWRLQCCAGCDHQEDYCGRAYCKAQGGYCVDIVECKGGNWTNENIQHQEPDNH